LSELDPFSPPRSKKPGYGVVLPRPIRRPFAATKLTHPGSPKHAREKRACFGQRL
jgi:hypothetical protein